MPFGRGISWLVVNLKGCEESGHQRMPYSFNNTIIILIFEGFYVKKGRLVPYCSHTGHHSILLLYRSWQLTLMTCEYNVKTAINLAKIFFCLFIHLYRYLNFILSHTLSVSWQYQYENLQCHLINDTKGLDSIDKLVSIFGRKNYTDNSIDLEISTYIQMCCGYYSYSCFRLFKHIGTLEKKKVGHILISYTQRHRKIKNLHKFIS